MSFRELVVKGWYFLVLPLLLPLNHLLLMHLLSQIMVPHLAPHAGCPLTYGSRTAPLEAARPSLRLVLAT